MEKESEYYAFISYKRENIKEAKRLQNALEYYRLPNHLRQENPGLPEYVRPIFRDMTDLEVGELTTQIHSALTQSHFLIVVCSPRAAKSKWVNSEIEYFISLGKQDKIIPYIIDGFPHANNPDEECLPTALLNLSGERELLGANINEVGKDSAIIRVVSRMFNIRFDALYQRYRREKQKRRRSVAIVTILSFVLLLGISGWIWRQNLLLKERQWRLLENQARATAEAAIRLTDEGDNLLARRLAASVMPDNLERPQDRPYVPRAEYALWRAWEGFSKIRTETEPLAATMSSDMRLIATGHSDNSICIWDAKTGALVSGPTFNIVHKSSYDKIPLAWSPDGNRIASGSEDSSIIIWDANSGEMTNILEGHRDDVDCITFNYDGTKIISGSHDGTLLVWDISTKCLLEKTREIYLPLSIEERRRFNIEN